MKNIVFFIDKQKFSTTNKKESAGVLLGEYANEDQDETTLVLKKGNDLTKYDDDEIICLENGMHFIVFHDGPTPVSYSGSEKLIEQLIDLGYCPKLITASDGNDYVVLEGYTILLGKFIGRVIDLGFLATKDFPNSVASAIHVRTSPQLFEKGNSLPNVRNITDSVLGSKWCYWSINFNWKSNQSARRLISQINTIFQNA